MAERRPDTIAAIATAPGRGGVGIVRISGTGLSDLATRLNGGTLPTPRYAHFRPFLDEDGQMIDEGLLLYFPAPHSFTGEDVIELQGHGGPVVLQLVLERCLALGARLAEPGEFTQRAFLNDKLDLAQAEAVADLIEASTTAAARSAVRSLSGAFSGAIHDIQDQLITLRMLVEATLDFPEEEIDFLESARAIPRMEAIRTALADLIDRSRQGAIMREGLHVVLVGQPNVGKSSLLNQLAGEERAIVTDIAGTTRDALKETIQIAGIPLHIVDTAGLRDTGDAVERIGIERTWKEIERADVILRLVDARTGLTAADHEIDQRLPAGIPRITVSNKCDLVGHVGEAHESPEHPVHIRLSAKTGEGVHLLRDQLLAVAGWHPHAEDTYLARKRHLTALDHALDHVVAALSRTDALELMAEELRRAHEALGDIVGEFTPDDLLGEIFSRFCIGK
ncbi:tRNA uridine-5-carboxymethylaminomethyl(34) synthesis GTPase MnmE [Nitrogeniibacter mangrovi]|uniref:tRNA modification GTPase MnmE n=1 Tax=Nitrogeniibacter mangrovi TaxID=2016596 RepID=A0A6C1B8E6_9RHOO|nr:tRNA uridine-5-carboxymethylaminomethyl(34) synthesis GTPase MnmE [Nitrogeniibacter mangrovi]QID19653.1 tRNA uridine-5-carboxymethylaminomethyl(34) synthesis GTPase MnmE [Nitrogeniibacter mangrovi]